MGFEYCYTETKPTTTRLTPLNVYGTSECNLHPPKGYEFVAFRPPALGEVYMPDTIVAAAYAARGFKDSEPRLILRARPEKIIRVIRVLEYVGPEAWIDTTMARNAVKDKNNAFLLGSDRSIRELSRFQEEVK